MIRRKPFDHLSSHPAYIMNKYHPSHCSTRNLVNSAFMRRRVAVYSHSFCFACHVADHINPLGARSYSWGQQSSSGSNTYTLASCQCKRIFFFFFLNKCCTASTPRNALRRQLSRIGSYRPISGRTAKVSKVLQSESASACVPLLINCNCSRSPTHSLPALPNVTCPFTPLGKNPRAPFLPDSKAPAVRSQVAWRKAMESDIHGH